MLQRIKHALGRLFKTLEPILYPVNQTVILIVGSDGKNEVVNSSGQN